jgi:putative peptide zinc metalloprotease protein
MLAPAPYIDTSGAWGLRNKLHRIIASAAGILGEFTVAAVAAIVWANSASGSVTHAVAYNLMFVASVSTFLFNGNPLLRYDAYYILCDILETPNLAKRSQQYLYYLVKRYIWRVENVDNPAHTRFEPVLFFCYGIAAALYRVFLLGGILLTVAELAFFLGVALAVVFGVMWVLLPIGKFIRYLLTSGELARVRTRAVATTLAVFLAVAGVFFFLPLPDRFRLEGMAEAPEALKVFAQADGELAFILPNASEVREAGSALARLDNPWLDSELASVQAREKELLARFRNAERKEPSEAQSWRDRLEALQTERRRVEGKIAALTISAPVTGAWFSPQLARDRGRFVKQGEILGEIIPGDRVVIRASLGQDGAASLLASVDRQVEIRVKNRPDLELAGDIIAVHPAGKKELPTPAMGVPGGGGMQVDPSDMQGMTSQEHFFEIEVQPHRPEAWTLRQGQMLVLRFSTEKKPLWVQCRRALQQMFQRRFHV